MPPKGETTTVAVVPPKAQIDPADEDDTEVPVTLCVPFSSPTTPASP